MCGSRLDVERRCPDARPAASERAACAAVGAASRLDAGPEQRRRRRQRGGPGAGGRPGDLRVPPRLRIDARLVVVGMVSNGFSIADPHDPGMLDVVGFDTATPQFVSDFARGAL